MKNASISVELFSWIFVLVTMVLGVLNLIYIHPVPGLVYLFLSLFFLPPVNRALKGRLGFSIPFVIRILLFLVICWFTLGISDLAEMYGL